MEEMQVNGNVSERPMIIFWDQFENYFVITFWVCSIAKIIKFIKKMIGGFMMLILIGIQMMMIMIIFFNFTNESFKMHGKHIIDLKNGAKLMKMEQNMYGNI